MEESAQKWIEIKLKKMLRMPGNIWAVLPNESLGHYVKKQTLIVYCRNLRPVIELHLLFTYLPATRPTEE